MKRFGFVAVLSAAAFAWAASGPIVPSAEAQPKPRKGRAATPPPAPVEAPEAKEAIVLSPEGLRFGMSFKEVAELYDKLLDKEYVPLYRKVQPGPKMNALDAEVQEKKLAFRRSRVDFGALPTGIDQTALAGEYGYKNDEAMMSVKTGGGTRFFFFFQEKLWKVYDEIPLQEGGEYGASYQDGLQALAKRFGVAGRVREADPSTGRKTTEVDWVDATTHVRALDRGWENVLGLVHESRETARALVELRKSNQGDPNALDPAVLAITRGSDAPEPTEPPKENPPKGKKKK